MPNTGVITIRSTHFYLIDCRRGKLMYEAGWVGQMPTLLSRLRAYGVAPGEIKFVMYSHNHTDHASLVQEVKQACGARLLIHEVQIPHLPWLQQFHARKGEPYVPIRVEKGDLVVRGESPRIPTRSGSAAASSRSPATAPTTSRSCWTTAKPSPATCPRPASPDWRTTRPSGDPGRRCSRSAPAPSTPPTANRSAQTRSSRSAGLRRSCPRRAPPAPRS